MRITRSLSVIVCLLILFLSMTQKTDAAYVGNPHRVFNPENEEKDYAVFLEVVSDIIYDRGAKFQSDDMRVDFYGATAGLILKNICFLYGGVGATKVEEEYTIRDMSVRWESDYGFTWSAGATFRVYRRELEDFYNSILLVGFDGEYRNTDIDPDLIGIDQTEYNMPHTDVSYSSMEYNDWHLGLSCALKFRVFSPYIGIKYSDFESCVRLMRDNIVYQKDNAEAGDNFGIFIGMSVDIIDSLYANIEAGFIDEDSVSASLSLRF